VGQVYADRPLEEGWPCFVQHLREYGFTINSLDTVTGEIQVTFSTDDAAAYVDCGTTNRVFRSGGLARRDYAIATSGTVWTNSCSITRDTQLEGYATIYLDPKHGGTLISTDGWYELTIEIAGPCTKQWTETQTTHTMGTYEDGEFVGSTSEVREVTKRAKKDISPQRFAIVVPIREAGSVDWGIEDSPWVVTCRSSGGLEEELAAALLESCGE
jgi:hypothetical protein